MTFINEYVPEDDIRKYKLEETLVRYNPSFIASGISPVYKFTWTIDRDRGIYLIRVRAGREELSHQSTWVFFVDGNEMEIVLGRAAGGSRKYDETPYVKILDLVRVILGSDETSLSAENTKILKEALSVYGDRGIDSHVDDVVVKFNF